ncbi:DUF3048 domain-containing protein [Microcella alkaliphila]|jgi:hypothetical protein|uniref:DUF3048 domain-containing protein n=1 Tax=Microcella alkaliphila TaxID=279828 RepID=A0A0U4WUE3_9MICO|nr:DUF3048 domain-containing protein [Microcella alkaliphila]BAU31495.1 uncharacterized protein MalAC0309_0625 [Microcella alkaliphila]
MRSSLRRRAGSLIVGLALVAGLGACAPEERPLETASPEPSVEPEPTYESTYEAPPAYAIAPLTGEIIEPGSLDRPVFSAKIDNAPLARPQLGLDRADIVHVELVEGGSIRYAASWHSDLPDEVGPVRSVRPMDPDIVSPFGGILAYSGAQQQFIAAMLNTPVRNIIFDRGDDSDLVYRGLPRPSPHNVVARAAQLVERYAGDDAPRQQFAFADRIENATAARDGAPASTLSLRYGQVGQSGWEWSEADGRWLRSQGGQPDVALSGTRLSATNVIVLRVRIDFSPGVPQTLLAGQSGSGFVATDGKTIPITWSKAGMADSYRLLDDQGVAVRLAPGTTWIELVPDTGDATITAG